MNPILAEQRRRNRVSRSCWAAYAGHRRRVTQLLRDAAAAPGAVLCVLGAGNCNDLDLVQLAEGFREIQLCDLDDEALTQGVAAQPVAEPHRVRLFGGVDLSGIGARLAAWSRERPAAPAAVAECIAAATAAADPLAEAEPADVAASVCVLSQLIEAVTLALGARHPDLLALVTAVRRRHLELLLERTRPGGAVVLVTDFVSALTCPELATTAEDRLPELTTRLIQQRNFFTGLNPFVLRQLFLTDAALASRVGDVRLTRPWLWHFPARTYAVVAVTARKKFTPAQSVVPRSGCS